MEQVAPPIVDTDIAIRVGVLEKRFDTMDTRMTTIESTMKTVQDNTSDILAILTAAKGGWGFVMKHGPKLGYALVGIAISSGWISAETGHSIGTLFGLH